MNILADKNIDGPLVRWLREQGHDAIWVAEKGPGTEDPEVLTAATARDRILLTFDRDFGDLVFRQNQTAAGVVLLRLRTRSAPDLLVKFQAI